MLSLTKWIAFEKISNCTRAIKNAMILKKNQKSVKSALYFYIYRWRLLNKLRGVSVEIKHKNYIKNTLILNSLVFFDSQIKKASKKIVKWLQPITMRRRIHKLMFEYRQKVVYM
jgi:hypothetical protein